MANVDVPPGSLCGTKRKYTDDPTKEVYEAAKSGNAILLGEVLQGMNASERAFALETKTSEFLTGELTPLLAAAKEGNLDCVKVLLSFKADIEGRGKLLRFGAVTTYRTCTPLCVAAGNGHVDVLSCLVENGADVNARTDDYCTPLMEASEDGHVDVVTFLVEHGANIDLQDENGNTALHYAVHDPDPFTRDHTAAVFHKLLSLGASQLFNSHQLTPLLYACNKGRISVVEDLLQQLEYTDEQRIDAFELLGASLTTANLHSKRSKKGFEYMEQGMDERFEDPSRPLLKQPMEPVEAYQNRKECQTPEELAQIEDDRLAVIMEGLIIRERILGTNNMELIGPIHEVAEHMNLNVSLGLHRHAMKIARCCNQSAFSDLCLLISYFHKKVLRSILPREEEVVELLEQAVLECQYEQTLRRELEEKSDKIYPNSSMLRKLLYSCAKLVQIIAKCEEIKTSRVLLLLEKLFHLNPQDDCGNTLLHKAVERRHRTGAFPCTDTVKLILNAGSSVNVINNNGDSPLHKAVKFEPDSDQIHLLTDMLEVLLDGGAHHDFVNNDGETAMDMAQTDVARSILSEKRKLELKCISARAVKKFGLPYLGVVPKTLEKYISRH